MKITYTWTQSQFIRLALYDYELGPQRLRSKLTMALVIVTLAALLLNNLYHRNFEFSIWDLVLVAVGLCWYALRGSIMVRMFTRSFKRSGMEGLELNFDVKEEGINIQVTDRPQQQLEWGQIKRVIRTRDGFLVYPGPMWFPAAKLEDGATTEELAALLQRKVEDYQDQRQHQLKLKDD
ncbi:hypothetical protein [Marinospirillum alkaliphilum]|uniref:YcxB-like protein n=1 Tax=Marinospirillum alkaliphilum DSM 21637 TaxID=1122209 RepID=A0A1K1W883_9GAMM|nr:hypothetical protein [Marinospirillum alkaliphilum]SFX33045.1 hypothetical protein SAMN02745752_01316 [Marinospirillum alkaliphilum DSM 21637]